MTHPRRSPDIPALLAALERHEVRFLAVGSVVALLHGVELTPGDLDIVPAMDRGNLERLAALLLEIEARPEAPFGEWIQQESGRWKWFARPTTQEELDDWKPDPERPDSYDHLLTTKHGDLDVVPRICGTYEELLSGARHLPAFGKTVLAARFEEVLSRIERVQREKDRDRIGRMRAASHRGSEPDRAGC